MCAQGKRPRMVTSALLMTARKQQQCKYSAEQWQNYCLLNDGLHTGVKHEWCSDSQSCLTLGDPMDCSLPGSSVHEIFQARILEWVAISFSRGSSQLRDQTWVSHTAGRLLTLWVTMEGVLKCQINLAHLLIKQTVKTIIVCCSYDQSHKEN